MRQWTHAHTHTTSTTNQQQTPDGGASAGRWHSANTSEPSRASSCRRRAVGSSGGGSNDTSRDRVGGTPWKSYLSEGRNYFNRTFLFFNAAFSHITLDFWVLNIFPNDSIPRLYLWHLVSIVSNLLRFDKLKQLLAITVWHKLQFGINLMTHREEILMFCLYFFICLSLDNIKCSNLINILHLFIVLGLDQEGKEVSTANVKNIDWYYWRSKGEKRETRSASNFTTQNRGDESRGLGSGGESFEVQLFPPINRYLTGIWSTS